VAATAVAVRLPALALSGTLLAVKSILPAAVKLELWGKASFGLFRKSSGAGLAEAAMIFSNLPFSSPLAFVVAID